MDNPTPEQAREAFAALGRYIKDFRAQANQLASHAIGGRWWKLGVPANEAARWANLGYLPEEAAAEIHRGITIEMATAANEASLAAADGNREEQAMRVIDGLIADGTIIDRRNEQ